MTDSNDYPVHLIFDIESLGVTPDCVVLSLACVPFQFRKNETFESLIERSLYIKFNVEEQIKKYHRKIDEETILWWKKQSPEAKKVLYPSDDDVTLEEGLLKISDFIKSSGYVFDRGFVWARGSFFDIPIIENLYRSFKLKLPFNHWKVRDVRTYIDILTGSDNGKYEITLENFIHHNSLHDAAKDAIAMIRIAEQFFELS